MDSTQRSSEFWGSNDQNGKSAALLNRIVLASEIKQEYLATGCWTIDEFLNGGIPSFGITEVTGESASGKTQLCLQLALMAQLRNHSMNHPEVVYISTEKLFPSQRLAELTEHFKNLYGDLLPPIPMDYVNLEHISDTEALLQCLKIRLPNLMREKVGKIRLIIVDSIAALFRADYGHDEMEKRAEDLRLIGTTLHNLSRDYKASIFVVNQVTGSISYNEPGRHVNIPSLGLAWANLVTTRLILSRTSEARLLSVKFAPHIPCGSLPLELTAEGFRAMLSPPVEQSQDPPN